MESSFHTAGHKDRRCGYVALVGKPNVGKSTLLNQLLGQKISITSRKPQTTRHRIHGIVTEDNCQMIFVDTPGVHRERDKAISRAMNKAALSTMSDVDVVVFLVDRLQWTEEDELVLSSLKQLDLPVILVINKVDKVIEKNKLLPHMQKLAGYLSWSELIPISAKNGHNQSLLLDAIRKRLPFADFYFDEEQVTDRSEKFIASELIREKLMRQLGDEVPYKVAVEIENYTEDLNLVRIDALVWVEREGQKRIIIGKNGERLKQVGIDARKDIENMLDKKVMLKLWVKVKQSWSDDERMLKSFGYDS